MGKVNKTIKVGIIGTGRHGSRYANHIIHDISGLELTAICRRSPEGQKQAETWNVFWHYDWSDLIRNPEVEAVIAVTPPHINPGIAEACVRESKPLLIEKPLAVNSSVASQIVHSFRSSNIPLTVGHALRFNSTIKALQKELYSVGTVFLFSANHRLEKAPQDWQDNPDMAGGGVILHNAVHIFDALRFITGHEVVRVHSSMFCHHTLKVEDLFTAQVEMEGGLVGMVDASNVGKSRSGHYVFVGSEGQLQGDQVHGIIEFIHGTTIERLPCDKPVPTILPLLTAWRDYLQGKGANPVTGEDGLAAVIICDACRISAIKDKWVEVKDILPKDTYRGGGG
jgi:predicted dehydrogenase